MLPPRRAIAPKARYSFTMVEWIFLALVVSVGFFCSGLEAA
jgi:hypothetical protein